MPLKLSARVRLWLAPLPPVRMSVPPRVRRALLPWALPLGGRRLHTLRRSVPRTLPRQSRRDASGAMQPS